MNGQRYGNGGYDFEKRFQEWKQHFDEKVNRGLQDILTKYPQEDPLEIPFKNAEYRVRQIQETVQRYDNKHRTQEFVAIMESITDAFTKEVDKLQELVEYVKDGKERKKELSAKLTKAQHDLEKKVHQDSNCRQCKEADVRMRTTY